MNGEHMAAEMAEQPAVLERLVRRRAADHGVGRRAASRAPLRHRPARPRIVGHRGAVRAIPLRDGERPAGRARVAEPAHALSNPRRSSRLPRGRHQPIGADPGGRQRARADARHRALAPSRSSTQSTSPLGDVADVIIDLAAGDEIAIPATKTFTATLMALALVAAAMGPVPGAIETSLRFRSTSVRSSTIAHAPRWSRAVSMAPTGCSPLLAGLCLQRRARRR